MKTTGTVVGVLMVLLGTIWILQGLNILPGSFMTGQMKWAVYGTICAAAGLALTAISRRNKRPPAP